VKNQRSGTTEQPLAIGSAEVDDAARRGEVRRDDYFILSIGRNGEAILSDLKKFTAWLKGRAGWIVKIQTSCQLSVRLDIRQAVIIDDRPLPQILVRSGADDLELSRWLLIRTGRDRLSPRAESKENGDCRDKVPVHFVWLMVSDKARAVAFEELGAEKQGAVSRSIRCSPWFTAP